ncbi:Xylose repressor XylR [Streptomyces venezuelae]|uniref:ROK family transcriptional regulator n=1 Tax=Streptomyces gardneri TaxID=66892 RepID=UPI0006BC7FF3|nr:ROK family transcriptional regulator [Streptomyces gardneri]ALO11750.1 Xylose repressor XylR [Streptomyces venezuelae]QPK48617.1 ROK family transcriptional regulator [Streptomyces gardneri]WRK40092.1 ROK family transcriptional regulator [Streptomyces venezuelae]CUM37695.1 ROK family transcriptional regulator [Streptomyces venezuelae]
MTTRNGRTVRDLRRENRTAVLHRLYFDGPMSRFSLGPATGLSSGSVSNVVAELVAEGLVEEAGSVDSAGGRPRILLRVTPGSGCMIGVDVGETRVRVELFDLTLTELARAERPLAVESTEPNERYEVGLVVGLVRDAVAEVLRTAEVPAERLLGVGVGVPGIVARTAEDGAVVHGQTIGWDAVPLERLLREAVELPASVPYRIDNGAKTLGQAEMWFGAGRGARSAVVTLFGSGVGACVVTDPMGPGRALEWGHLTVRVRGRRCRCGSRGCLEAYAGAGALVDRWREAGGAVPAGAGEETALTAMLAAAYPADAGRTPDAAAVGVLEETAEYLGAGFADLINLFQPERILVGGWAGLQLGARFLETVKGHAREYALAYPAARVDIAMGTLGPDAVTVGAAILPLADFFARGGRRAEPDPTEEEPAWAPTVRGREAR